MEILLLSVRPADNFYINGPVHGYREVTALRGRTADTSVELWLPVLSLNTTTNGMTNICMYVIQPHSTHTHSMPVHILSAYLFYKHTHTTI